MSSDPSVLYETSLLSDHDLYLFHEGTHTRLYEKFGAHPSQVNGAEGAFFAVWAPDAAAVNVIGDFNGWNKTSHPLKARGSSGVWEGFIPGVAAGSVYKYAVTSRFGGIFEKCDPFAVRAEVPPRTASVVHNLTSVFGDNEWRAKRGRNSTTAPMSIYEVHLGSWKRTAGEESRPLTYLELAKELPDYVARLGFTHVEFLPIMEHPFGGSWGYQVTGFFAPTSRFGTPEEFMQLIDAFHSRGIGVILDWVPSHFPTDGHGLSFFDGTHLFEHQDPRKGFHPDWNTLIFNYGRHEVRSFLLSSACFWLDKYKVDGLRVDAVASMLYLDYSRKDGEWIPNMYGGRENLEAITFLRALNERVFSQFPHCQTIAEESTSWPMVSRPVYLGGLGFGMKWDMGWMNDTLRYMGRPTVFRKFHHNELTFRMMYAYSESFVLPLSHDEVVHGKGSMVEKMPGDEWQKMANLRLLYGYMWGQPGKKLLFMGLEFGQKREWNHDRGLDFHLLEQGPYHAGVRRWVADLNQLYRSTAALHELDTQPDGFKWIDCSDADKSVLVFFRRAKKSDETVVVACNFTEVVRNKYRIGVPRGGQWTEVLNSDAVEYGGSGVRACGALVAEPLPWHGQPFSIEVTLPPLSSVYLIHRGIAISERPLGAVYLGERRTRFRIWAPLATNVQVQLPGGIEAASPKKQPRTAHMIPEDDGYYQVTLNEVLPGDRYTYTIDGVSLPDPASRYQPDGVTGPSAVVSSCAQTRSFAPKPFGQWVIYELHVGTFTSAGTFDAAAAKLSELVDLGINAVELLPVAEFSGAQNWGYDGVFPYAVHHGYGGPEGLARFVDACHSLGIAVILDVVYNHLGPEGAVVHRLGPYFSDRYQTPWGKAFNFDGEHSDEVRKFFLESALYFVTELGVDALRLDAVNAMIDTSPQPFLVELGEAIRRRAADLGKTVYLIGEGDSNEPRMVEPADKGGLGLNALWNDDFHHALHALLTGERGGYYADYGTVEHLAKSLREGFVYTGEKSSFRKRRHGKSSAHLPAESMVVFSQNHDQVGNRTLGERLITLAGVEKAKLAAAVTLLSPYVPLLFMGEEYGETAPFCYFTDFHNPALVKDVEAGRIVALAPFHFAGVAPNPQERATFVSSQLTSSTNGPTQAGVLRRYYQTLLKLRREVPAFAQSSKQDLSAVAFADEQVVLLRRWTDSSQALAVFSFQSAPVEVTLPVPHGTWQKVFDSGDVQWEGPGAVAPATLTSWGSVRARFGASSAAVYIRQAL
ncbi:MAG: 1,4-alpha-glucan branching protein GlgB [Polyangiaceae bacterium]|nr:1,4-alpha-glucan branching protein GlgB [Polyangiaceae bacterium]